MTEYWVSQSRKWCEHCKIFLADNVASIRMHEQGTRHKEAVAQRLSDIKKKTATDEKEQKKTERDLKIIEKAAKKQYEKDLEQQRSQELNSGHSSIFPSTMHLSPQPIPSMPSSSGNADWKLDPSTGYYFNSSTKYYFDANSGLYYSDIIGKWATQEEALRLANGEAKKYSSAKAAINVNPAAQVRASIPATPVGSQKPANKAHVAPGQVRDSSAIINKGSRAMSSSLQVTKRKRDDKPVQESADEIAAREAREAARKRTESREKQYLGLYQSF